MAESEKKILNKQIQINNGYYDVTATYADKAGQVTKQLKVTEHGPAGKTNWDFDGSKEKNLDIVPASGGTFSGDVAVGENVTITTAGLVDAKKMTVETAANKKDIEVLNKSEIYNYVTELSGASWFTWDGENKTLTAVKTSEDKLQRIAIVEGLWEHFEAFKSYDMRPATCLYLGKLKDTITDKDTTADGYPLGGYRLDFVKTSSEGTTSSFTIGNQLITTGNKPQFFTIERILALIDSLKDRLDNYKSNTDEDTIEYKIDSIANNVNDLGKNLNKLNDTVEAQDGRITTNETNIGINQDNIIKIENGTTVVGKAESDNRGYKISTHYYRICTDTYTNIIKPDTNEEHQIFLASTAAKDSTGRPADTLGNLGDILIYYNA